MEKADPPGITEAQESLALFFVQILFRPHVNRYLYVREKRGHKRLIPDRYEFFICRLLRDRLEAGDIYCRDSVRFRSFEDDLMDEKIWRNNKEELIERVGLPILNVDTS